jgi:uncharacterized RDD family membrane protein YckC
MRVENADTDHGADRAAVLYAPPQSHILLAEWSDLVPAGRWRRLGAKLIDFLVWLVVMTPLMFLFQSNKTAAIFFTTVHGLSFFFYSWYMEGRTGQTIGKRAMKMRVVSLNGVPMNLSRSLLRNALLFLQSLPFAIAATIAIMMIPESLYATQQFDKIRELEKIRPAWYEWTDIANLVVYLAHLAAFFFTAKRQTLADLLANTMVADFSTENTTTPVDSARVI